MGRGTASCPDPSPGGMGHPSPHTTLHGASGALIFGARTPSQNPKYATGDERVCLPLYLRNDKLLQMICACCLWPWLGLRLGRCDMLYTSGFVDGCRFPIMVPMAQATQTVRCNFKMVHQQQSLMSTNAVLTLFFYSIISIGQKSCLGLRATTQRSRKIRK